ncbi:hypothetical protein BRYFOR_09929 [Marvinbryantia formatexigens DSM 14469]|uniref:Uncharacterized protein n=1 Tax=Marvinbryantia formatexigens DSM 14469 TaxID=478749 RepID=C6LMM8_9FIRM|nr:hypothetical protein BRYFOR_09929 [Marvinbryantia formatexigens DSM 14469]
MSLASLFCFQYSTSGSRMQGIYSKMSNFPKRKKVFCSKMSDSQNGKASLETFISTDSMG